MRARSHHGASIASFRHERPWILLFTPLGLVILLILGPAAATLALGFRGASSPLSNHLDAIGDELFLPTLRNTVIWTAFSVLGHQIAGLSLALLLQRQRYRRIASWSRAILLIPWVLPPAVVAGAWLMLLHPFGLVSSLLQSAGLRTTPLLSDPGAALATLVVINVWEFSAIYVVIYTAALAALPPEVTEAAQLDGAGPRQLLRNIVLPQIRPVILVAVILDFIWSFQSFDLVYLMTKGGPADSTSLLSFLLFVTAFRDGRIPEAAGLAAVIVVLLLVPLSAYWLTTRARK